MEQEQNMVVDKLTPIGERVLVNIWKKPQETSAGFLLPENENQGMPVLAQIAVLGKKTIWQKVQIFLGMKPNYKVGQWVYFRKYSIDEFKLTTEKGELTLYVLEEPEIIGLVN
jgi:co-chaperonin GroES (HSP10)